MKHDLYVLKCKPPEVILIGKIRNVENRKSKCILKNEKNTNSKKIFEISLKIILIIYLI
jgi:hypothetical protein